MNPQAPGCLRSSFEVHGSEFWTCNSSIGSCALSVVARKVRNVACCLSVSRASCAVVLKAELNGHVGSENSARDLLARDRGNVRSLAAAVSQVVRAPGMEARPLRDGTPARPLWLPSGRAAARSRVGALLWPACRRVLPTLLAAVDGHVEQVIAVVHNFDAPRSRPVSLEDLGSLSEVANDMH